MRQLYLTIPFLFLLWGCGSSEQVTRKPHVDLEFPEPKSYTVPEIERFTYNGIEFFLLQDDELPLINVNVLVNGGSWMDPVDKVGLASLTGTVLRSGGSEQYPDEKLNELLENRAASMETGFGLSTGSARMNVLKEDFEVLLPVFTDLLDHPLLSQERLDLAKTRRRTAISRRNEEPSDIASREFRKLIYGPESVYARTVEYATLENITRQDLVDFHRRTYQGSNMLVGVIGDFDPGTIREKLQQAFGVFEEGEPVEKNLPEVEYEFKEGFYFANKSDMNQSQIRLGHIGGYRDNPDYAALQVMNQILSGGFSGRLMQEVRTEKGLAYSVYGNYSSNVRYPGVFYAGLSTAAETTREGLEATMHEIRRLQSEPVEQQELEETKERIFNRIIFRYDNYAQILSERMNNYNLDLPEDAFEQYIEEVRQVTVEDINRVANEYLQPDNMKLLIVGNRNLIEDQLAKIGEFREVDISIPQPSSDDNEVQGDREAGQAWMGKMASALLEDDADFEVLMVEGSRHMQTPQGEIELKVRSQINFPDAITMEMSSPMGSQTLEVSGDRGVVKMGGQEQQLQQSMIESILRDIKRDPLNLAMNSSSIEAVLVEEESSELVTLYIAGNYDLTIHIDNERHLPVEMSYTEFDQEEGREVEMRVVLENWQVKNGVYVAYDQKRYANGELVTRTEFTDHNSK